MNEERKQESPSPFEKEPAEGSRETIDKQQRRKTSQGSADPVTAPSDKSERPHLWGTTSLLPPTSPWRLQVSYKSW